MKTKEKVRYWLDKFPHLRDNEKTCLWGEVINGNVK